MDEETMVQTHPAILAMKRDGCESAEVGRMNPELVAQGGVSEKNTPWILRCAHEG